MINASGSDRGPGFVPCRTAAALAVAAAVLAGCGSAPPRMPVPGVPVPERDGPEARPPPLDLDRLPDAQPQIEPIRLGGPNRPYEMLGRDYAPFTDDRPYRERGGASWYGRKFHGRRTANGEIYDMYAMTAAHPTLPLPSYARVTNPANGRQVIVRVNDRGPFHRGRVIDLSYAAAHRLGVLDAVRDVVVTRITFDDIRTGRWRGDGARSADDSRRDPTTEPPQP